MTVSAIRKRRRLKKWLIFALLLIAVFLGLFEFYVRPTISAIAVVQGKQLCNEIINKAVDEALSELRLTYDDLSETTRNENGAVLEITSNMANINKLKTVVGLKIGEKLGEIKSRRIDVPIGTVIGVDLFYMRGPNIPLHISMSGNADTYFKSEFESGGINQTVHRLSLAITADITVLIPPASENTVVETNVIIAETIIAGEVPDYMLYGPDIQ